MLKFVDVNIVFQEIPDEVTLAVTISGCPNHCKGCHSPYLWEDIGKPLTEEVLSGWLATYGNAITCLCFMGGDQEPEEVGRLAGIARSLSGRGIKLAWYSGKSIVPPCIDLHAFDYLKLGPYIKVLGGLSSPNTNQRLYRKDGGHMVDMTVAFWKSQAVDTAGR